MYKLKLTLMSLALVTMTLIVGGSLASMQERTTDNQQTNQNNSNQNRNGNRNSNRGSNNNSNMNRNGNSGSGMMNSNSGMMNSNSGMMNSNSSMMNSNSSMNMGSMNSSMDMMGLTTIGNMSMEEFMRINAQGAASIAAITPTSQPLSKSDQKLMMEVAMGGMMQLEISRAALQKVTSPQAKILAQSEVEEQTGLSAKLQEIAAAKGMTMPASTDSKAQSMIGKMQNMSGADADRYYIRESGVKGHEKLDKTMSKVESKATDESLKALAMAAHPQVRAHLQISRDIIGNMSGNGNNSGGSMNSNSGMNSNRNSNSNSNRNMNSNGNSNRNSNR